MEVSEIIFEAALISSHVSKLDVTTRCNETLELFKGIKKITLKSQFESEEISVETALFSVELFVLKKSFSAVTEVQHRCSKIFRNNVLC